jgi:hypothetical protein
MEVTIRLSEKKQLSDVSYPSSISPEMLAICWGSQKLKYFMLDEVCLKRLKEEVTAHHRL